MSQWLQVLYWMEDNMKDSPLRLRLFSSPGPTLLSVNYIQEIIIAIVIIVVALHRESSSSSSPSQPRTTHIHPPTTVRLHNPEQIKKKIKTPEGNWCTCISILTACKQRITDWLHTDHKIIIMIVMIKEEEEEEACV